MQHWGVSLKIKHQSVRILKSTDAQIPLMISLLEKLISKSFFPGLINCIIDLIEYFAWQREHSFHSSENLRSNRVKSRESSALCFVHPSQSRYQIDIKALNLSCWFDFLKKLSSQQYIWPLRISSRWNLTTNVLIVRKALRCAHCWGHVGLVLVFWWKG